MTTWADELDALQEKAMAALGRSGETIQHVTYIVSDLRKGEWEKAKIDYAQQSDKFGSWKEIENFLFQIGVAERFDPSKYFQDED